MRVTRRFGVDARAAEVFHRDVLAQNRLDDVRSGDKHLRDIFNHEYEVGQRRRINRAAGTRAENQGNLRDNARSDGVAIEDFAVAGQRADTLLDTGATGIVDTDNRAFHLQCMVHNLGNLAGVLETQRTAGHREVLRVDADRGTENRTRTCNYTITRKVFLVHAKIATVVLDEHVVLVKRILVQQGEDTFARRHLAHGNLLLDGSLAATHFNDRLLLSKCLDVFVQLCHNTINYLPTAFVR